MGAWYATYAVLERFYADACCSDDRQYYQIVVDVEEPGMMSSAANGEEPDLATHLTLESQAPIRPPKWRLEQLTA